jgi:L-seryl-tRNA(Ser) seleniumtransferase
MEDSTQAALRQLPSIDELLHRPSVQAMAARFGRELVARAARQAVQAARARILRDAAQGEASPSGEPAQVGDRELAALLERLAMLRLRPVINASGVLLHTNLGRAPLPQAALERMAQVGRGYCNLEFDLEQGERGSRYAPVEGLLRTLTGAEAALVVNNGAAAVLLVLSALARDREAIVSRGESVEIGGGFRIPEVMAQSGATVVEVGTTNKTRLSDYERALTDRTGLLMKVHRSNFALVGFTAEASVAELCQLGSMRGVPVFYDLGSGYLGAHARLGERALNEPTVPQAVQDGADLVAFSGDKLLGGPQCGIVVGKAELIRKLQAHPLCRALRVDKLTVAALEATLELYERGQPEQVPVLAQLGEPEARVQARAERLCALLGQQGVAARVTQTVAQVGGGTQPLTQLPSHAVVLERQEPQALLARLRAGQPAAVGRVERGALVLDVRGVSDPEVEPLSQAVGRAVLSTAVPVGQG